MESILRRTRNAFKRRVEMANKSRKNMKEKRANRNVHFDEISIYKSEQDVFHENISKHVVWSKEGSTRSLVMHDENHSNTINLVCAPCHQRCQLEFPGKSFVNVMEDVVDQHKDQVAVTCDRKQLTYQELNENVNRLARSFYLYLYNTGILDSHRTRPLPDEPLYVSVMIPNSINLLMTMFALWKLGICVSVIDLSNRNHQVREVVTNTNSSVLIWDTRVVFGRLLKSGLPDRLRMVNCGELLLDSFVQDLPGDNLYPFECIDPRNDAFLNVCQYQRKIAQQCVKIGWKTIFKRLCWQWREIPLRKVSN